MKTVRYGKLLMLVLTIVVAMVGWQGVKAQNVEDVPMIMPINEGERWYVYQGYESNASHSGIYPTYRYSFDLMREGDTTGFQSVGFDVLAPISGKVTVAGDTGSVFVSTPINGGRYLCATTQHLDNISVGETVSQGQKIGTSACKGCTILGSNNPHIHFSAFTSSTDNCYSDRQAVELLNVEGIRWHAATAPVGSNGKYSGQVVWRGMNSSDATGTSPVQVPVSTSSLENTEQIHVEGSYDHGENVHLWTLLTNNSDFDIHLRDGFITLKHQSSGEERKIPFNDFKSIPKRQEVDFNADVDSLASGTWDVIGIDAWDANVDRWYTINTNPHPAYPSFVVNEPEPEIVCDNESIEILHHNPTNFGPGALISGQFTVRVVAKSSCGISHVNANVRYRESVDGEQENHVYENIGQGEGEQFKNTWMFTHDLMKPGDVAVAQRSAYLAAEAFNINGESIGSVQVPFDIAILDLPVNVLGNFSRVDPKTEWVNQFPVTEGDLVEIEYVDGRYYPGPTSPGFEAQGDPFVCLYPNCDTDGGRFALMLQNTRQSDSSKKFYTVGRVFEDIMTRTGDLVLYASEIVGKYGNNSGDYNVLLSIYPAGLGTYETKTIGVELSSTPAGGEWPILQVWVKADNGFRRIAEWRDSSPDVHTRNIELAASVVDRVTEVWVLFVNDAVVGAEDRNVFVSNIWVDGQHLSPTAGTSQYCMGNDYGPFLRNNCVAGTTAINSNGALILYR